MPTKKKRVGFIPREEVMKIIDNLSIENNLSNSKIISLLVEEALTVRGIFNRKTAKGSKSYQLINQQSQYLTGYSTAFKENEEPTINPKIKDYKSSGNKSIFEQMKQDEFDLQTYKKFLSFLKFQELMNEYNTR